MLAGCQPVNDEPYHSSAAEDRTAVGGKLGLCSSSALEKERAKSCLVVSFLGQSSTSAHVASSCASFVTSWSTCG